MELLPSSATAWAISRAQVPQGQRTTGKLAKRSRKKGVCVKWPTNLDRKEGGTEGQVELESAWAAAAGSKKPNFFPLSCDRGRSRMLAADSESRACCHLQNIPLSSIIGVQGCTQRLFPGCVKLDESVLFCLPTAGRRTQFFHPIFSQPRKSLLEVPCKTSPPFYPSL